MSRRKKVVSSTDMAKISGLMREAKTASDLRRLQCVYFRGQGIELEDICKLVQYHKKHIKRIWTEYFKNGVNSLITKPKGGRNNANLSEAEEIELLEKHSEKAKDGKIIKITPLHKALCEKLKKDVAISTTYRLAHRHGWRKIEPRPRHPKRDENVAEYFKIFFPETGGRSKD